MFVDRVTSTVFSAKRPGRAMHNHNNKNKQQKHTNLEMQTNVGFAGDSAI